MKKKIVVFTGAGVSAESGVATFRDTSDGLWYNYKVEEVATIEGWKKDRKKVLDFHNMLRSTLKDKKPNDAHKALVKLEDKYDVTIVTQNVDNLHEQAGSTNVLHLHGEIFKSRSTLNPNDFYDCPETLNVGEKCKKGSQLRPHTVLFGEMPYNVTEAYDAITVADYLLIIGTSLEISYTLSLLNSVNRTCEIIYIDPKPSKFLDGYGLVVKYVRKKAVEGVDKIVNKLLKK